MTTLFLLGEPGRRAVLELLERGTPAERRRAVRTLGTVPEIPPSAIPGLVRRYQDLRELGEVRGVAAAALVRVRPVSPEALRWIDVAMKDRDEEVTRTVAMGLTEAGCTALPALPLLKRQLATFERARRRDPTQDGPAPDASPRELFLDTTVRTLEELDCRS